MSRGSSSCDLVVRGESESITVAPTRSLSLSALAANTPPSSSAATTPSPSSSTVIESAQLTPASLPIEYSSSVVESFEKGSGSNVNTGRRPAWNKPSNDAAWEVEPVMGAVSWPALSKSTQTTMKSSSESLTGLSDESSVPQLQGTGSTSSAQGQVGENLISTTTVLTGQKSMKLDGLSPSSNGGHPKQSASQASMAVAGFHNSSPNGHAQRSVFVSQPHNVNVHPQHPNSFRNRNGGPHQRGDVAHRRNYNRREQGRGNQDWYTHQNFDGRGIHIARGYTGLALPNSAQFVTPLPMRPYGGPIGYSAPSGVYPRAPTPVPYGPPMPPHSVLLPPDHQLYTKIVEQIDYYFSEPNLIKDTYLRKNMDDQGWVPIELIARFNKIMLLTDNIQLILDAVRGSSHLEVQGDKIRKRNDWWKWPIPPSVEFPNVTAPRAFGNFGHKMLNEQFQSIGLGKTTETDSGGGLDAQPEASQNRPTFGGLNSSLLQPGGERTGQVSIQGSGHSISARN